LIDRLEGLLDHSTRLPFTSRVVIDEDEYLRLIDQMRISVPQEISRARQVEAERDAILSAAQEQAEAMMDAAREKAELLVAEHAIMAQAEERSNEILTNAYDASTSIRADADAYALEVLEEIAGQLDGFDRTVQGGIRLLREGRRVQGTARPEVEPRIIGGEAGISAP
jgi:hypothetical protein